MKTTRSFLVLFALCLLAAIPGRAGTPDKPDDDKSVLHITVDGGSDTSGQAYTNYDRMERAILEVVKARKWTRPVTVEKLIGGTPRYANELRINIKQPWDIFIVRLTLILDGKRQDLGDVFFNYKEQHTINNPETRLQEMFSGSAAAIAARVEPLIFPDARQAAATKPAGDKPVLHVTVAEVNEQGDNAYTDFNRLKGGLERVAQERNWPVTLSIERLVGNTPKYDTELRLTLQRVQIDPGADYSFRSWVSIIRNGQKQDFGLIRAKYNRGTVGKNKEDVYQGVFYGGAGAVADQVETVLFPGFRGSQPAAAAAKSDDANSELHVSVVETLTASGNAYTDFDRFDTGFKKAAKQRQWPAKVSVERFAGNTPNYATELRITLQRVRREPIEDYVFRAWAILIVNGEKHDFGIVTFHYSARMGQNFDDIFEKTLGGGAAAIADLVEPVLYPELNPKKKK